MLHEISCRDSITSWVLRPSWFLIVNLEGCLAQSLTLPGIRITLGMWWWRLPDRRQRWRFARVSACTRLYRASDDRRRCSVRPWKLPSARQPCYYTCYSATWRAGGTGCTRRSTPRRRSGAEWWRRREPGRGRRRRPVPTGSGWSMTSWIGASAPQCWWCSQWYRTRWRLAWERAERQTASSPVRRPAASSRRRFRSTWQTSADFRSSTSPPTSVAVQLRRVPLAVQLLDLETDGVIRTSVLSSWNALMITVGHRPRTGTIATATVILAGVDNKPLL